MKLYVVDGVVKIFPQQGGWYYLSVPRGITKELSIFADRGLIPVVASIGKTAWNTSLLPTGDGTHFIALNAKVRKNENVVLGDTVRVEFLLRDNRKGRF